MLENLTFMQFINMISGVRYIIINDLQCVDEQAFNDIYETMIANHDDCGDVEDCIDVYSFVITDNSNSDAVCEYQALTKEILIVYSEKLEKIVIGVPFYDDWNNYVIKTK